MSEVKTNKISSLDSSNSDITLDPDGTGDVVVASGHDLTVDTDTLFVDAANNRVGIGMTSPVVQMHIKGSSSANNAELRLEEVNGDVAQLISLGDEFRIGAIAANPMTFRTGNAERMRLSSGGKLGVGGAGIALNPTASITVEGTDQQLKMYRKATNSNFSCIELRTNVGSTNRHVFNVAADGDVTNVNNSYGSLSDASLKENVSAAASQWDDIKAVQVKNYSMIADNADAANSIGVIAQDLEASGMNGLVKEMEDGTKTVKYSVLYMKAVKALQEAMTKIEALEARVTALENA